MSSNSPAPKPRKQKTKAIHRTPPSTTRQDQFFTTKFDLWLQRGSHIAQAGLFVLTIFTIFYTVIPLYQTAALQEAIVRQEKELETLRKQANLAYLEERERTVGLLAHMAIPKCTGLMDPLPDLDARPSKREDPFFLRVDVATCIRGRVEKNPALSNLRPLDRLVFKAALDEVLKKIDSSQQIARTRYAEAPSLPADALPPHSPNLESLLRATGATETQLQQLLWESRVSRHQVDIGSSFRSEINKLVGTLSADKLYDSDASASSRKGS